MKRRPDEISSIKHKIKVQRLASIRYTLPWVSQRALLAMCQWAHANGGLPDIHSTYDIRRAREEILDVDTPYGKLLATYHLQNQDDSWFDFEMLNPWAALYYFISKSKCLSEIFEKLCEIHKPAEAAWRLIYYSDEVTPGNQLAHKHARKVQAIYFSFLEFGPMLSNEDLWFTATLVASSNVSRIKGGNERCHESIFTAALAAGRS